ncbi:hypothetical protein BDV98DRAFT_173819 [Pterulicium gracile]|uniref:Uncharacterized protein n=1 Tax=Pterulicium gracile TaxID=1884261 RepID=A0A5C3QEJ1_9AGAR|nr:hypothetical protein BDV98DRAFT_173819 [Pterula gracilis]
MVFIGSWSPTTLSLRLSLALLCERVSYLQYVFLHSPRKSAGLLCCDSWVKSVLRRVDNAWILRPSGVPRERRTLVANHHRSASSCFFMSQPVHSPSESLTRYQLHCTRPWKSRQPMR